MDLIIVGVALVLVGAVIFFVMKNKKVAPMPRATPLAKPPLKPEKEEKREHDNRKRHGGEGEHRRGESH